MKKYGKLRLCGLMLLSLLATGSLQQLEQEPGRTWHSRAHSLTDDLTYEAPRLDRYDRALMWARLGDAWWKTDPEQARGWFVKAIELLELSPDDGEASSICRLTTARTILPIVATKDKKFHERLISIIGTNKTDQNESQRQENANALASVGLALVEADPTSAERFGEASLRLGFSLRIADLLWKLRARDQSNADKLFMKTLQVTSATLDINLLSVLTTATFQGPYSTESYQRTVLNALAGASERGEICKLEFSLAPLLNSFDALMREQSQKLRAALALCRRSQSKPTDGSTDKSPDRPAPITIDELLEAAAKAPQQSDHDYYLMKATHLAAEREDFDRAISILDSIDNEGRQRLKDSWDSLRWDYAGESACAHLARNERSAMMKVIEATPPRLVGFVNISLAVACKAATEREQVLEFMGAGRRQLEKADKSQQPGSYLSLVRLYIKFSPAEAPAVLHEAIEAINRASENETNDCESSGNTSQILTAQLLLKQYRLPASLLESDEIGVRNAFGSIRASDKRAAIRLQLLTAALEQHQMDVQKSPAPKSTQ